MSTALQDMMDQILAKGRAEGEAKGKAEGEAKGRAEGKAEGRFDAFFGLVRKGLLSADIAAREIGLSVSEFSARMEAAARA